MSCNLHINDELYIRKAEISKRAVNLQLTAILFSQTPLSPIFRTIRTGFVMVRRSGAQLTARRGRRRKRRMIASQKVSSPRGLERINASLRIPAPLPEPPLCECTDPHSLLPLEREASEPSDPDSFRRRLGKCPTPT